MLARVGIETNDTSFVPSDRCRLHLAVSCQGQIDGRRERTRNDSRLPCAKTAQPYDPAPPALEAASGLIKDRGGSLRRKIPCWVASDREVKSGVPRTSPSCRSLLQFICCLWRPPAPADPLAQAASSSHYEESVARTVSRRPGCIASGVLRTASPHVRSARSPHRRGRPDARITDGVRRDAIWGKSRLAARSSRSRRQARAGASVRLRSLWPPGLPIVILLVPVKPDVVGRGHAKALMAKPAGEVSRHGCIL